MGIRQPSPVVRGAPLFASLVFGVVAFAIVAKRTRSNRLSHLLLVAVATWATSLVNLPLFGVTLRQWLFSLPLLLVMMVAGWTV